MSLPTFISPYRVALLLIGVLLAFGGVIARLSYLHITAAPEFREVAVKSRAHTMTLDARRGDIIGSRGEVLATSRELLTVGVDPYVLDFEDFEKADTIALALGIPAAEVRTAFQLKYPPRDPEAIKNWRPVRWKVLARRVPRDVYDRVRALGVRAVYGNAAYERVYPGGHRAAHLIGFINATGEATGVERYLDYYLRGQPGWRETQRDGSRRKDELVRARTQEIEPHPGHTVQLSIDTVIQHRVEQILAEAIEKWQPTGGATIIVSDARTGFLHALASAPTFDLNDYGESTAEQRRNRALAILIEPGSTFKIVSTAAALDLGVARETDTIDCAQPSVEYRGRSIRLPEDDHAMGVLSVREVLVKSSNRGAAHLGMAMGEQSLYDYARAFGYGEPTRLGGHRNPLYASGFPEETGLLAHPRNWDGLTISRMPMGHAIAATPLQVHMATSVIANDGVLMRPQVVSRILDHDGSTLLSYAPERRRRVISSDTASLMREMLAEVPTPNGTARHAAVPGYRPAGKTGTTQKVIDGRYSREHHIASFSGFLPAEDPELVITVVLDDPQGSGVGYGGSVAGPIFAEVAKSLVQYLGIESESAGSNLFTYSK
ncbi:MAG: peptidoglycan D,D-transpeptidase FtsI family protein [Verrucomicrobiota bacterium]